MNPSHFMSFYTLLFVWLMNMLLLRSKVDKLEEEHQEKKNGKATLTICKFSGDEAADGDDTSWNMDCSTVVRVKTIHISSPILAAKSPFFYKVCLLCFSWCSTLLGI